MKYLKKFNESKKEDIIQDIKDMCLELEDMGIKINIKYLESGFITIAYDKKDKNFHYSDIKGVIDRVKRYLGNKIIHIFGTIDGTIHIPFDIPESTILEVPWFIEIKFTI